MLTGKHGLGEFVCFKKTKFGKMGRVTLNCCKKLYSSKSLLRHISTIFYLFNELTQKFFLKVTPLKTNMTMENPPFEDVFPIEHGGFSSLSC